MKNVWFYGLCVAIIGGAVVAIIVLDARKDRRNPRVAQAKDASETTEAKPKLKPKEIPEGYVMHGGIPRPLRDVESTNPNGNKENAPYKAPPIGHSARLNRDTNPQVQSLANALQEHRESKGESDVAYRFSAMQRGPKFDLEEFKKDPQKYVNEPAASRIWDVKPEGADVKPIKRENAFYREALQGETQVLRVKVEPFMPVNFYAPQLGQFEENQLAFVTVLADEDGIAEARYTPTGGTHGITPVLASSPVNSLQARFVINVKLPDQANRAQSDTNSKP
jgi:hypothetical protein